MRKRGHTLSEIMKVVPHSKGTIFGYLRDVVPYKKFQSVLESKIKGTQKKAEQDWITAHQFAQDEVGKLTKRDFILIASMLYWGEGNKKYELNLINSDPYLVRTFIRGLNNLGVPKSRIKISLRLYGDIDERKAIEYWIKQLGLMEENLVSINYLIGKKDGKLPYGMCRLRVQKGGLYFKQLISIMEYVKKLS